MNISVCDKCKNRNKEAKRVAIFTGRYQSDPVDGSSPVYEHIDLCLDCMGRRLEEATMHKHQAQRL